MNIYEWTLQALLSSAPRGFAARSPVLAQLASLAQIRDLACRKGNKARWEDGNVLLWPKASDLRPDKKTQKTSKKFLEKRVSMELITMTLLWTLEISIQNKKKIITYEIIMQENQISRHVLRNFPVYGTTPTEEDIASCSRTFRKHKNPKEERKFIENGTPKSKTSFWKYCLKPGVQRLDTAEANLTTESLNF